MGNKVVKLTDLITMFPKNGVQKYAMSEFLKGQNLTMLGASGTGKTFLGLWLGLREVLDPDTDYSRLVVVRSAVPVKDIGFLPGTLDEKTVVYEAPYSAICNELFDYSKSWELLKNLDIVQFLTTSFLRGITLRNAIILVDECQSLNAHELDSIITRVGSGSKIIFCGDYIQTDLLGLERRGLEKFMRIIRALNSFSNVTFTANDSVRSGLVREYILARDRIGLDI